MCISEDIDLYIASGKDYFQKLDGEYKLYGAYSIYNRLRNHSKQLLLDYDQISNTMYQIGECFGNMFRHTNEFNAKIGDEKVTNYNIKTIIPRTKTSRTSSSASTT